MFGAADRYGRVSEAILGGSWLTFGEAGSKALEFAASLSLAAPSR
jgi:hypothetical protein